MPGDPLRAKIAAETFLKNSKLVNQVRGMYAYTGTYKGKKITIMAHGMGIPSIGIYSYELFKFYDVDYIIRIGTAGGYKGIEVGDVIISNAAYSYSTYAKDIGIKNAPKKLLPSKKLLNTAVKTANEMKLKYHVGQTASEDAFYNAYSVKEAIKRNHNSIVVEMEAYALYANAQYLKKNALTILTCSDSFFSKKQMSSKERQESTKTMIKLALNTAIKLK